MNTAILYSMWPAYFRHTSTDFRGLNWWQDPWMNTAYEGTNALLFLTSWGVSRTQYGGAYLVEDE